MAYIINNTRGNLVATVADGTINNTTIPVTLVGRGVTEYGLAENENYVYLLENFCAPTAPPNAMQGQLWFDSNNNLLNVRSLANTWIALASETYVQEQKASPAFSGVPTAPTATAGTNNTQIATTAFVGTAVATLASSVGAGFAPINSPVFTGTPAAPSTANTDSSTRLATTAFVQAQKIDTALTGTPTAPTAVSSDSSSQVATTAFVQAQKIDTALTGSPTAPTTLAFENSTRIATTEFVQAQKNNTALTGFPTAPTQVSNDNSTRLATTAFVQAQKFNMELTGVPTAPTAPLGTQTTQIATTEFVFETLDPNNGYLGTMAFQNANNVIILGGTISNLNAPLAIASGGTGATDATNARANLGIPLFPLSVSNGGTGASDAANARINLGLGNISPSFVPGTIATQNANSVSITGGSITGITDIAVADGGTGASTAVQARINLGLGNLATQANNAVLITGGQIYGLNPALPVASGGTGSDTASGARTNLGIPVFPLNLANGGTGGTSAVTARTSLGLGTIATQNANAVTITGGDISGITALAIADGGTGAVTAAQARTNLELASGATTTVGTMATQNANSVVITGGIISGVNGVLPVGSIIMWYGSLASIPTGWQLCNGSSGTPDLRDRFVVGAGSSYAVGSTGGSADAIVVQHTHSVTDPGHNHQYQIPQQITNGEFRNDLMAGYNRVSATTSSATTGISISSTGSSGVNANLPPYHALCYIMRVV